MFLITGASGTVGRPLVEALHTSGHPVRAVSREPRAADLPVGVEVVAGDPSRPSTLASHLDGVTGLFLHARAAGEAAAELVALAREHGVRRVVALAASNVDDDLDDQPSRFRGDRNREAEAAAIGSGLEWVSLRPTVFAANAVVMWAAQIRAGDVVRGPYAAFAEAPIHEQDLADVAARALTTSELSGRLELTGPKALTHEERVTIIGEVLGRPLRFVEISPDDAIAGMSGPKPFATALMARYARDLSRPARVTGEVAAILGRPARTFAEWVTDNKDRFS